ncbi:MAG: MFS transporter [Actinomycetota bacterium]
MRGAERDRTRSITPPRTAVRRLAAGRVISLTGTFGASTALNFAIWRQTHSSTWVAATMLLTFGIIGFFGPVAGAIADRFDRRRLMMLGETGAAGCWLAMATVRSPAGLLALAFAASLLESPFFPASSAAIPNLAGTENLSWANSLIAIGRNAGITLGPLLGGLTVGVFGAPVVFAANAVSHLVSVLLVASVHGRFSDPERRQEDVETHAGLLAGFRFIGRDRVLRTMAIGWFVFLLGMGMSLVADPALAGSFHAGSFGYGMLTAGWGLGTILGSILGRRAREEAEGRWLVGCSFALTMTAFGVALAPVFGIAVAWVVVFGLADGPTLVIEQNLLQRRTPDVVRGRVVSGFETVMHGGLSFALLLGALVEPTVGPKGTYAAAGVLALAGSFVLLPLVRWLPGDAVAGRVEPSFNPVVR